jgi:hypothetical protein
MTGGYDSIPLLYRDYEAARNAYGPLVWYNPYKIDRMSQHMVHERLHGLLFFHSSIISA